MKEGGGGGGGEGRKEAFSSLSSPPPPRLLAPFFARPLLRNSTETLASQATAKANHHIYYKSREKTCLTQNLNSG